MENFISYGVIWKIVEINTVLTPREVAPIGEGSWGIFTFNKIVNPLQGWKLSLFQTLEESIHVFSLNPLSQ